MHVRELGAGEDERGGAVDGRDQRGGLPLFQGGAERGGERCGQRVGEQGGAAAAREARGDGVVARRRARSRVIGGAPVASAIASGTTWRSRAPRSTAAGDVAVRGGGEQLAGLDGPEPVPVEHPHDTDRRRAALGPPAQRGAQPPGRRRARRRRRSGHEGHGEQGSRARRRPVARTAARLVAPCGPARPAGRQATASDAAAGSAATRSRASSRTATSSATANAAVLTAKPAAIASAAACGSGPRVPRCSIPSRPNPADQQPGSRAAR